MEQQQKKRDGPVRCETGFTKGSGRSQSSDHRGILRRWNEMVKTGGWFANVLKKDLDWLFRLVSNDSSSARNRTLG